MHRTLLLHRLRVPIVSETFDITGLLRRLYTDNDLTCGAPQEMPAMSVQFERAGAARSGSEADQGLFAETTLCGGRCYFRDGRFVARTEGQFSIALQYDLRTDVLEATLSDAYAVDEQSIVIDLLRPLLQSFVLPLHGLKSLHGAVAVRSDRAIFLAGEGGAGKSTTAIELALAGWDVLSDDGPLFALFDGKAKALSSLDFLHATGNTLAMYPQLERCRVGGRDRRGKYAIDRALLSPGEGWRVPAQIDAYIELHRAAVSRPRLVALHRRDLLRRLVAEHMFVFRNPRLRTADARMARVSDFIFALLTSLASSASFYRLEYDNHHLPELPRLLESL